MKRSRCSEEQIIVILKEQEAGMATAGVCRCQEISSPTLYKWKSKYGGLEVSEARRLRALEKESARLKKLLAEAMLVKTMAVVAVGAIMLWATTLQAPVQEGRFLFLQFGRSSWRGWCRRACDNL